MSVWQRSAMWAINMIVVIMLMALVLVVMIMTAEAVEFKTSDTKTVSGYKGLWGRGIIQKGDRISTWCTTALRSYEDSDLSRCLPDAASQNGKTIADLDRVFIGDELWLPMTKEDSDKLAAESHPAPVIPAKEKETIEVAPVVMSVQSIQVQAAKKLQQRRDAELSELKNTIQEQNKLLVEQEQKLEGLQEQITEAAEQQLAAQVAVKTAEMSAASSVQLPPKLAELTKHVWFWPILAGVMATLFVIALVLPLILYGRSRHWHNKYRERRTAHEEYAQWIKQEWDARITRLHADVRSEVSALLENKDEQISALFRQTEELQQEIESINKQMDMMIQVGQEYLPGHKREFVLGDRVVKLLLVESRLENGRIVPSYVPEDNPDATPIKEHNLPKRLRQWLQSQAAGTDSESNNQPVQKELSASPQPDIKFWTKTKDTNAA